MKREDKNVNGYNCCGCGENVWCLARVNCTRRPGGKGSRGDGLRGGVVQSGGRDTWRAGRFRRVAPRISAFIRVVSSSFRRWISRLASAADSPAVVSPRRFDLPFFGISPRTQAAVPPTNRIKVRFKHFRPKVDSGTIVLHVVSWNREIIDSLHFYAEISISNRFVWLRNITTKQLKCKCPKLIQW